MCGVLQFCGEPEQAESEPVDNWAEWDNYDGDYEQGESEDPLVKIVRLKAAATAEDSSGQKELQRMLDVESGVVGAAKEAAHASACKQM